MAAKTTVKVATLTGAAKDDNLLSSATGINEDHLSGNLNVLANDPGSAHLYSLKQDVSGLAPTATFPAVSTAFSAAGATISINADGTIAYNASNLNLTHLADGVAFTDSFTYTIQMANGAYSTAVATVQLMGANDAPTLAAIAAATIHDTAADDTPAAITGTLVGADADDGAVLTYSISGTSAFGVATVVGANYSFTADANAIDALQQGESATATFTATVTDEHGASASRTMAFTLVGANDTTEFGGVTTGSVTEDTALTTGAIVTVADRDHDQSGFQAATAAALIGNHGAFTFNAATGAWGYSLNNADLAVQGLWSGETLTDTLTVASIDGSTQNIVVTINGSDDAAVFGGVVTGSVTEDGPLTAGGTATVSDLDHDQSGFQAAAAGELAGDHGNFTFNQSSGAWGYSLNNADTAVQGLWAGETLSDTMKVFSIDGSEQDIVVTIHGTDDAAVFGGVTTGSVTEDGPLTAAAIVTVSDLDHDQSGFLAATAGELAGDHGNFTFNQSTGAWGYSLNNADTAVQGLWSGETLSDTMKVLSIDGTEQDIVVTIHGTDDAAVFGGAATGSVTEDGPLTAGGTVTVSDLDHDQSGFQAATAGELAGDHGNFTFNQSTGAWGYSLNNADTAVQGLWSGETLAETMKVFSIDGSEQDIVVTIHGANDAAVFGGAATGNVTEDGTLTTGGTVTVSDLDHDQSAFQAATLAELTGDHGTFTFTAATGAWGYTLNNADAAVQALNTGSSLTDTMQVLSADGSAQNIVVTINGADEAVLPPTSIPPTPVKHVVNNGLTSVNGHKVITDFVTGDLLQYASNLSHNAPVGFDNDNNGTLESTAVTFTYNNGNSDPVQVVLVGYTGTVGFFHEA